ncbi:MAG: hypothetical protein ACR2LF_03550 [Jatrophihabitantaceae bacterium]
MGHIGELRQHFEVLPEGPDELSRELARWLPAGRMPEPEPMPVPSPEPMPGPDPVPGPEPAPQPPSSYLR